MNARLYTGSATIERIDGKSTVSMWVETQDSGVFRATGDPKCLVEVTATNQGAIDRRGVLVGCMSGARSARHFLPIAQSTVVIKRVKGHIAQTDVLGISIATVAAIARALGREDLLPPDLFQTFLGDWRLCD
jgi:hypothetical protein